jgi:hypothetical protein
MQEVKAKRLANMQAGQLANLLQSHHWHTTSTTTIAGTSALTSAIALYL